MRKYFINNLMKNILIIIGIIIISLIQVGTSLIHTFAFNSLLDKNIKGFLSWYGIGLLLWIIFIVGNYFLEIAKTNVIQNMIGEMRRDIAISITKKSFSKFKEKDTGEFVSLLNNDMNMIETLGFDNIYNIISTVSLTLLSLITLLTFDFRIMLITIAMTFVISFVPNLMMKRITNATKLYSDKNSEFMSKVHDLVTGYETLYYLGNKRHLLKQVDNASEDFKESKIMYGKDTGLVNSVISTISVFAQIIIMISTGYFAYIGLVTFGAITSTASVAGNVFGSLSSFNQYLMSIKSIKPILEKIHDNSIDLDPTAKQLNLNEEFEKISINNLNYDYSGLNVLNNFNLDIKKGNKYALIGPSGSGKSTLISILLGNLKDYEGSIKFNNNELKEVESNELINHISFVSDKTHIYNDTLLNNITLWDEYPTEDIQNAILKSNLQEMETRLNEEISEKDLSEGQKQRIGLARAFLKNRNIIVLDEATANLDSKNSEEIENIILNSPELTYITVTHHLEDDRKSMFDDIISLKS